MNRIIIGGIIVLLLATAPAFAATIHVGTHVLVEDMADQTIQVRVTGTAAEQIGGMNLRLQVADGGPDLGGSIDGPKFTGPDTGGDLRTGAIFEGDVGAKGGPLYEDLNANGHWDPNEPVYPQFFLGTAALPAGTVDAHGLLATITISTEGFFVGDARDPWALKMTDLVEGAGETELLDNSVPTPQPIPLNIHNGTITLVPIPEPATIVMLLGMLAAVPVVFLWGRRK